jgi:hypothetical protein
MTTPQHTRHTQRTRQYTLLPDGGTLCRALVTVEQDGHSGHWCGVGEPLAAPNTPGTALVHTIGVLQHSRMVFTVTPNGVGSDCNVTVEWWIPAVWSQQRVQAEHSARILVDLTGSAFSDHVAVCPGNSTRILSEAHGRGVWAGLVLAGWVPLVPQRHTGRHHAA